MRIGLVCSQGGHLTEMLELINAFAGHELFLVTYFSDRVDALAKQTQVFPRKKVSTGQLVGGELEKRSIEDMKIGLVCSQGGHMTQMMELQEAFGSHDTFWITYFSKRADVLAKLTQVYQLENIGASPVRLLKSLWPAWRILRREKPALLVSTGSEIALPFFYLGRLMGIKMIYVESVCRINTPSQTGKLVYPIVDQFYVQWPGLAKVYGPKARYVGGLL